MLQRQEAFFQVWLIPAFLPPTLPTLSSPSEVLHLPSQPELLGQAVNGLRTF